MPPPKTQEKLDRLAEEASNVVEKIAKDYSDGLSSPAIDSHYKRTRSVSEMSRARSDSDFSLGGFLHGPSRMQSLVTVSEDTATQNSVAMSSSQSIQNVPRSSTIDSAVSNSQDRPHSSSSGSHVSAASPGEIGQLIQAAGSPEAVIGYLLKDKSHVQAQNTQLWRLVDKQRAMILGLNRDLERALRDKERYRKKLKEHLAMFPAINGGYPHDYRNATDSPAPSELMDVHSPPDSIAPEVHILSRADSMPLPEWEPVIERSRNGSLDVLVAPYPIMVSAAQQNNCTDLPITHNTQECPPPSTTHINCKSDQATAVPPEQPKVQRIDPSQHLRILEAHNNQETIIAMKSPQQPPKGLDLRLNVDAAANFVSRGASSPLAPSPSTPREVTTANERKEGETPGSETRPSTAKSDRGALWKAPPARLEFDRHKMPFEAKRGSPDHDESNYDDDDDDDNISVEEIPGYEQRMRERQLMDYDGKLSGEECLKQVRARDESVPRTGSEGRAIAPDAINDTTRATPGSIDSIIAPVLKQTSGNRPAPLQLGKIKEADVGGLKPPLLAYQETIGERKFTAPYPMSPGLPSSPRPAPNSPLPRPRRDVTSPEPLSPRSMQQSPRLGLPASPRVGLTPGFFPQKTQGPGTPMRGTFSNGLSLLPLGSPNPFAADRNSSRNTSNPHACSQAIELLIEPMAVSTVKARVVSSRMKPSRASFLPGRPRNESQDSVFTLGIFSRVSGKEQWRVEKDVGALPALDSRLRKYSKDLVAELPDRSLFTGHAPARVDARRAAIDSYFSSIMSSSLDEQSAQALCEFLSADVVDGTLGISQMILASEGVHSPSRSPVTKIIKEGYLTKRGKNFGGWKSRYFVLDGPVLRYYEAPGGEHLGSIKLQHAQIGRQSDNKNYSSGTSPGDLLAEENQYRHAFLILEPKRKDSNSLVRHVLCAENDAERDEWVEALMQWVDKGGDETSSQKSHREGGKRKKRKEKDQNDKQDEDLRAFSYEDATPGVAPARGPSPEELRRRTPTPTGSGTSNSLLLPYSSSAPASSPLTDRGQHISKQISGPVGGGVISDASAWGNKTDKEAKALKKRSIWGFRGRTSSDLESTQKAETQRAPVSRMVFGVSLEEALAISKPLGVITPLPSVVYRCLEYLDAKNAMHEEGIFRLSGSNVVIKSLRDRFNSETDVNLLASDEYYDVHAVAGLLKLYLRELPNNILTTERREDFLRVTEIDDKLKKVAELNRLVHGLPIENFALLKALSGHLIRIVENANINKMTVRNVGIVFSPTLNIPAQVFTLFLQEYHNIFVRSVEGGDVYGPERDNHIEEKSYMQSRKSSASSNHDQSRSDPYTALSQSSHHTDLSDSPPQYDQPRSHSQDSHRRALDWQEAPDYNLYLQQPHQLRHHLHPDPYPQLHSQASQESLSSHNSDCSKSTKAKRRESSMLSVMGMRKSILQQRHHQPTVGMVAEDNLYD